MTRRIQRSTGASRQRAGRGFSLLELIVVVSIMGILAAVAMPNLIQTPQRAKEAVLKTNLRTLRQVIDQYYGDKGSYPPTLDVLVEDGYLRDVPVDPVTGEADWGLVYDDGGDAEDLDLGDPLAAGAEAGIIDVFSLSESLSIDGEPYADW
ncbi:MAG: prepilin-type N-terminal cleavage/methylation domain-containing protein [Acidobacteriota bacterium]